MPPLEPEPRIREWSDDLRAIGLHPFPIPLGLREARGRGTSPLRLANFDGYPDPTESKADAQVCAVSPALEHPNVSLLTRARVDRLVTSASGREVTEVHAEIDGQRVVVRADTVVLACGAINSAALLLRSACDAHPRGLANRSDQVGRNYMTHQNGLFIVVGDEENPSKFQKHFGLTDFYRGAGDSPLPLGTIQLMGKPDHGTLAWARGDALPGATLEDIARRTLDFFITAEDLPDPDNRITLRSDGAVRVSYTPNNTEAYDRLARALGAAIHAVDARRGRPPSAHLAVRLGVSGVSHQNGTLRFGVDPRSSVLDPDCKAHDLSNLYVVDSSFFPSSAAVNPSLTIMANALRVGDHLIASMGATGRASLGKEAMV